jgi:SWI/SNF-related matrix-associated actin-dependent regulator of chromatin subfamily A member 5
MWASNDYRLQFIILWDLIWTEMGLGKTLQTISLLAYLRESRGVRGPHLIIVPKSVVGNWIREVKKWCPVLKAIRMGGTKEEREIFIKRDYQPDPATGKHRFDILVTSYEGFMKEKGRLGRIGWKYLIIDEGSLK